jgi:hypothetical protein
VSVESTKVLVFWLVAKTSKERRRMKKLNNEEGGVLMKKLIVCLAILAVTGIAQAAPDKLIGTWESGTNEGWMDHQLNGARGWAAAYIDDPEIFGDDAPTPRYWWSTDFQTDGDYSVKVFSDPATEALGWGQRLKIDVHTDWFNYSALEFDVYATTPGTYAKINDIVYSCQTTGWGVLPNSTYTLGNTGVMHVKYDYSASKTMQGAADGYGSFIFEVTSDAVGSFLYFDKVMLTPEPATIGLLGLGGLALLRRKK